MPGIRKGLGSNANAASDPSRSGCGSRCAPRPPRRRLLTGHSNFSTSLRLEDVLSRVEARPTAARPVSRDAGGQEAGGTERPGQDRRKPTNRGRSWLATAETGWPTAVLNRPVHCMTFCFDTKDVHITAQASTHIPVLSLTHIIHTHTIIPTTCNLERVENGLLELEAGFILAVPSIFCRWISVGAGKSEAWMSIFGWI